MLHYYLKLFLSLWKYIAIHIVSVLYCYGVVFRQKRLIFSTHTHVYVYIPLFVYLGLISNLVAVIEKYDQNTLSILCTYYST